MYSTSTVRSIQSYKTCPRVDTVSAWRSCKLCCNTVLETARKLDYDTTLARKMAAAVSLCGNESKAGTKTTDWIKGTAQSTFQAEWNRWRGRGREASSSPSDRNCKPYLQTASQSDDTRPANKQVKRRADENSSRPSTQETWWVGSKVIAELCRLSEHF